MPKSLLQVESVAFAGLGNDAVLDLFMDDGQNRVQPPEWMDGVRKPVAIIGSKLKAPLRIRTVFRTTDLGMTSARIRPFPSASTKVIMSAAITMPDAQTVAIQNGRSAPTDWNVTIVSDGVELGELAIAWVEEASDGFREMGFTVHELAITLDTPFPPWRRGPGAKLLTEPWWPVVRRACLAASGARSSGEIASGLATAFFHRRLGGMYWWLPTTDYSSQLGIPTEDAFFDCARFLRLLEGQPEPTRVDCQDATAAILTFATVIGAQLRPYAINAPDAPTKEIRVVGHAKRAQHRFGQHQFVVDTATPGHERIWDGCVEMALTVAPNVVPTATTTTVNAVPTATGQAAYLDALYNGVGPLLSALKATVAEFRPIREQPRSQKVISETESGLQWAAQVYGFESWKEGEVSGTEDSDKFFPNQPTATGVGSRLVTVDKYVSTTVPAARRRLLAVLAKLHPAGMKEVPAAQRLPGADVEFRSADFGIVALAANNRVWVGRSAAFSESLPEVISHLPPGLA